MTDRIPVEKLDRQELHKQVAAEIMGWTNISVYPVQGLSGNPPDWDGADPANRKIPFYTENIEDAWKVVEAMPDHGIIIGVSQQYPDERAAELVYGATAGPSDRDGDLFSATAQSAPEAICRAALKAVRVK